MSSKVYYVKVSDGTKTDIRKYCSDRSRKAVRRVGSSSEGTGNGDLTTPGVGQTLFRCYENYTAITAKGTMAYKVTRASTVGKYGILFYRNRPVVAIGTGWYKGVSTGDTCVVTTGKGTTFKIVLGDIKADKDTDSSRTYTVGPGCACEFIVDPSNLNSKIRSSGNVASVATEYSGIIKSIVKDGRVSIS